MDVKVSTQTFLAYTNMNDLNLEKLFDEITPTVELIYITYELKEKGKKLGKKFKKSKRFLNCITFLFFFDEKKINLKLFKSGVIQHTGCKSYEHCEKSLVFLWTILKKTPSCSLLNNLNVYLVSIMRNVNLNLGFCVNGEKFKKYFLENKEHNLTVTINVSFTGARFIKPVESVDDMPVYTFEISGKDNTLSLRKEITYEKFRVLTGLERAKEKNISIVVFWTGRTLFSGIHEKYQDPTIKWFLDIILGIKDKIVMKEFPVCSLKDYLRPNKKSWK